MALKGGRVGVRPDQVDPYGRIKGGGGGGDLSEYLKKSEAEEIYLEKTEASNYVDFSKLYVEYAVVSGNTVTIDANSKREVSCTVSSVSSKLITGIVGFNLTGPGLNTGEIVNVTNTVNTTLDNMTFKVMIKNPSAASINVTPNVKYGVLKLRV